MPFLGRGPARISRHDRLVSSFRTVIVIDESAPRCSHDRVDAAEVDRRCDLRRVRRSPSRRSRILTLALAAAARQRRAQPSRLEQWRVDLVRERRRDPPAPAAHLPHRGEERLRRRGIVIRRSQPLSSRFGGEPDQLLLQAVVQRPLDSAALIVAREDEPSARGPQVREAVTELLDPCLFGVPSVQRASPLPLDHRGCPPSGRGVKRQAAGPMPGQPPVTRPSPPWFGSRALPSVAASSVDRDARGRQS